MKTDESSRKIYLAVILIAVFFLMAQIMALVAWFPELINFLPFLSAVFGFLLALLILA